MEKVKTATGKTFDCDYFNPFLPEKQVNIRVLNSSFSAVATVFSDPRETAQMWFENDYTAGFTKLIAIIDDGDAIRVVLGKD